MTLRGSFRFDTRSHRYTVGGVEVPAVGTIVKWASEQSYGPWLQEKHRVRGRLVHGATLALDLQADSYTHLSENLPADCFPFFSAYFTFTQSCVCVWRQLEEPLVHRRLMFAGTPDRVGTVNGYPALLELKTGSSAVWHQVQTAGQVILLGKQYSGLRRYVVYLRKDGTFRLREHTDSGDYLRFLNALARYHEAAARTALAPARAVRAQDDDSD